MEVKKKVGRPKSNKKENEVIKVKKKLGRPKSGRRDKYVSMPLNNSEFEHLKQYCKSINTNVSVTIRTLIFKGLESIKLSTTNQG